MKKNLFVLALLFCFNIAFACGNSYQYRLFPIGQKGKNIIALEVSLNRYWGTDPEKDKATESDRWKGVVSLISINEDNQNKLLEVIDTIDILDSDYEDELKLYFTKALDKAKEIRRIVLANKVEIAFCNMDMNCKILDFKKTSNEHLTASLDSSDEFQIKFPPSIIENSSSSGGMDLVKPKLMSFREITIGETKLFVPNFASGEFQNTNFEEQNIHLKECYGLENCYYKEITVYHGLTFDAIIRR